MSQIKNFFSNFVVGFAGAIIATTVFLLGKNLLLNHELGLEYHLLLSISVYTLLYSSLFALLHIGGSPTWGTTCFASALMVVATNLFTFADDKFASFTLKIAIAQAILAAMLAVTTYLFVDIDKKPLSPNNS